MNIFSYCSNNPVNCVDPLGMFEIGRDNFVLALDIMLDILVPQFSGPMDIAGKAIKAMIGRTVSYSVVSKVVKKLTKSTIPKFRGLFSKFFTLIRKAIWKVTGYYISNGLKTKIMNILKKLTNILTKYRIDLVVDIIFCLCSAGGWIALTIDIIDGNLNCRCRLW